MKIISWDINKSKIETPASISGYKENEILKVNIPIQLSLGVYDAMET